MEKEEVEGEIPPADLEGVFRADKAEVAPHFDDKIFQPGNGPSMQVGLGMPVWQLEELNQAGSLKTSSAVG
jgi:hypothetical protein